MSDWYDNQKRPADNFHKLLQERINNTHFHGKLISEDSKRSSKLEAIKGKLRCLEDEQNGQLQTWLNENKNGQLEAALEST